MSYHTREMMGTEIEAKAQGKKRGKKLQAPFSISAPFVKSKKIGATGNLPKGGK